MRYYSIPMCGSNSAVDRSFKNIWQRKVCLEKFSISGQYRVSWKRYKIGPSLQWKVLFYFILFYFNFIFIIHDVYKNGTTWAVGHRQLQGRATDVAP